MLRKISISLVALLAFFNAIAANNDSIPATVDSTSKFKLSLNGSIDAYTRVDFAKQGNSLTSFTPLNNEFGFGMASLKFGMKIAKLELIADLGLGRRARDFSYNDRDFFKAAKQLYASYAITDALKITAGTWATHVGYELVDPQLNRNYSMSYMFTNGPFTHTGAKADFTAGKSGFMLGVSKPTDYRNTPAGSQNGAFIIGQYSYAFTDANKLYVNFVGGKNIDNSKVVQFDVVVLSKLSDKLGLGFNGTVNTTKSTTTPTSTTYGSGKSWFGSAVYLNYDISSAFGITLREELFGDKNGLKLPAAGNVLATTLSANYKIKGFTIIPELRIDNSSKTNFRDKNGFASKSAANFIIAAMYAF
jgi:hypothetical protein